MVSEFDKWRKEQIKRGNEAHLRVEASGFKSCGHSALGCYVEGGPCCKDCDHATYWRALHDVGTHPSVLDPAPLTPHTKETPDV